MIERRNLTYTPITQEKTGKYINLAAHILDSVGGRDGDWGRRRNMGRTGFLLFVVFELS